MKAAISRYGWVSKHGDIVTNLLMDGYRGGRLTVPATDYPAFLDAHASDVARGVPMSVVEYPTEPSRPYVDMDIETEHEGGVCVRRILLIIQRAFRATLGEGARLTLLAMVAPVKLLANGKLKFGLHVIAPHARATRAELLASRSAAIAELVETVPISNEWSDAYDPAVYTSSGLRLVGANKFESCTCATGCTDCSLCGGRRRFDAGRPYTIHSVLASNGDDDPSMLAHLTSNTALLVKLGSIRCHEKLTVLDMSRTSVKRARGRNEGRISSVGRALSVHAVALSPEFGGCAVRDVKELRNGDLVLSISGVRYCMNTEAEHRSSSIYFYLQRDGWLTQRCYCPKYGCAQFRSPPLYASQELLRECGLLSRRGLPVCFAMP